MVCLALILSGTLMAARDAGDVAGSKDPSLFNRMPGFHISRYEEKEFARYDMPVTASKTQAVEGHYVWIVYDINAGSKQPSALQIVRNYTNAAAAIGGKKIVEYEDGGSQYVTLKIVRDDAEVWAHVEGKANGQYNLYVVEKALMRQDVVADASTLANSIRATGKVAVYGIYFDTGKWDIKPQSDPSLQEIAKLLKNNAALKLYVVGHTDNVGTFDANVKLSNNRADAVVKALSGRYGIAASRLQPFGAGPTSPVQSNQTEAGRAKNRRVELVAQ